MSICLKKCCTAYQCICNKLSGLDNTLVPLFLRFCLAWEFLEAGLEKLHGDNWFGDITFPFPFSLFSASFNWNIATYFELIGGIALLIGLATRFFSLSLIVITIVAIISVHFPNNAQSLHDFLLGYRIIDENQDGFGNYKLPLIFLIMLFPLVVKGSGKISLDHLIKKYLLRLN